MPGIERNSPPAPDRCSPHGRERSDHAVLGAAVAGHATGPAGELARGACVSTSRCAARPNATSSSCSAGRKGAGRKGAGRKGAGRNTASPWSAAAALCRSRNSPDSAITASTSPMPPGDARAGVVGGVRDAGVDQQLVPRSAPRPAAARASIRYAAAAALLDTALAVPAVRRFPVLLALLAAPIHLVALASPMLRGLASTPLALADRALWHLGFGLVAGLLAWGVVRLAGGDGSRTSPTRSARPG